MILFYTLKLKAKICLDYPTSPLANLSVDILTEC